MNEKFIVHMSHENPQGDRERKEVAEFIYNLYLKTKNKPEYSASNYAGGSGIFLINGANGPLYREYKKSVNVGDKNAEQSTLSELLAILDYVLREKNNNDNLEILLITNGQKESTGFFQKILKGGHALRLEKLIERIKNSKEYQQKYGNILDKIKIFKIEQEDWTKIDQIKEVIMLCLMAMGMDDYFAKLIRKITKSAKKETKENNNESLWEKIQNNDNDNKPKRDFDI